MPKKAKIIATVCVSLLWFLVLMFGGFETDWPWDALWTDPSAIRWLEVVKVMIVHVLGSLAIVTIWTWKKA
ncbi:MAG TPA: hypothetical protein VNK04_16540 [Gemmataceae bacterium]|nr:hypothetical protein [Gemmataceae bacterium]